METWETIETQVHPEVLEIINLNNYYDITDHEADCDRI